LKQGIHSELKLTKFVCGCGNEFEIYTVKGGVIHLEVCNNCHPFYTGKLRIKPKFLELQGQALEK